MMPRASYRVNVIFSIDANLYKKIKIVKALYGFDLVSLVETALHSYVTSLSLPKTRSRTKLEKV